ncbi:MAG TPA: class I SAM-dependent methyltransferase [Pseudomonadales bacterium]|nr:class I SAM-dependent methyltransferase [Pseudomonadales bacterium]
MGPLRRRGLQLPETDADGFTNADLEGYPNNHNYVVDDGRLIPGFNLYWRSQILAALYSAPLGSLLDVGSARGWFVLAAAGRPDCNRALGIDIYSPWIELASKVAAKLSIERASFRTVFLRELFEHPETYGAPFDNILIVNTYHYLFWGSGMSPDRFGSHEEILEGLGRICSNRVIFANPLEIPDMPRETRKLAAGQSDRLNDYTTESFLATARNYFDVEPRGAIGKRRLLILHRR